MGNTTLSTVAARRVPAGEDRPVVDQSVTQEAACCGATEQATCCEPSAKASCCGTPAAEGNASRGGCGCR